MATRRPGNDPTEVNRSTDRPGRWGLLTRIAAITTSVLSTLIAAIAAVYAARSSDAAAQAAKSAAPSAATTPPPASVPPVQPAPGGQKRPVNWEERTAKATRAAVIAALFIGIPTTAAAIISACAASDSAKTAAQAVSDAKANADSDRLERKSERERRYAELVVFSTSTKDNGDRELVVRNLGPVRITKPALVVADSPARVPLTNVKACSSTRYVIDGKWFEAGQVKLVFEDANGLWWSRAESEPLQELGTTNQPWGTGVPVDADARPIPVQIKGTGGQANRTLTVTDPRDPRIDTNRLQVDRATYAKNLVRRSYRWYVLTPRTASDEWRNENECPAQP